MTTTDAATRTNSSSSRDQIVHVRIPAYLLPALDHRCATLDASRAEVIRQALAILLSVPLRHRR